MTRTKSPAQPAPQTLGDALVLLERYAVIAADLARTEVERQAAIAAINAAADAAIAPGTAQLKAIALQLKPWWAVARGEIVKGDRKSAELGGCLIGYRLTTPKLHHAEKTDDLAVAALTSHGWSQFVRAKLSLDKPAIVTFLGGDHGAQLASLGFEVRQREEFFVDRLAPKPVEVEAIEDAQAGEVA